MIQKCGSSLTGMLLVVAILGGASPAQAQQITITNPSNGSVFSSGSTISVTATVTGGTVAGIQVGLQDAGLSAYQYAAPYTFSVTAPATLIGPRNLFAVGAVANGNAVFSTPISIDFEPATTPIAIHFQQSLVAFGYVGDQEKISVNATFGDGSTLDISSSSRRVFTSADPTKVSVNSAGLMTSLAPGKTTVTVAYGTLTSTLQIVGPSGVKGDIDGDGVVTLQDLLLLEAMTGTSPTVPNDARDLNGDGKIDYLDVQALQKLCGADCPSLAATTLSLTTSAAQVQFTQPMSFTGTVSGTGTKPRTGTVSFLVDGQINSTGILGANGQATALAKSLAIGTLAIGTHTISAAYSGDSNNAPSSSAPVSIAVVPIPGDVNADGVVNCLDLALVKASFGKKAGQPGFNPNADVNNDGVVNILDLSFVARLVPAGVVCQ